VFSTEVAPRAAAFFLDEPLGVLAAKEHLDGFSDTARARQRLP
jgi:hypothetical protein